MRLTTHSVSPMKAGRVAGRLAVVLSLPLAVACSSTPVTGMLTDGLTEAPMANVRLLAKAQGEGVSPTCLTFEATTDAAGAFTFPELCANVTYGIVSAEAVNWLPDAKPVTGGTEQAITLQSFWAPEGNGVYIWTAEAGGKPVRSNAKSVVEEIEGQKVSYPKTIPNSLPLVEGKARLVLAGTAVDMVVAPVVPAPAREWFYIGATFTDETTFTRTTAAWDAAQSLDKTDGTRTVRYLTASSLPAGRYALYTEGDSLLRLMDMGKSSGPVVTPDEG